MAGLLSICIFVIFAIVGFAAISVLNDRRTLLLNLLVAPATGIAVIVIPTLFLSRLGFPVHSFAGYLIGALLVLSAATIALKKPLFPWRVAWPFIVLAVVALALTDRPLFEFGFDWVSFSNNDMLNYSLGSDRLAQVGYYAQPGGLVDSLSVFRGYFFPFWILHAVSADRTGVEQLLALVVSITRLRGFQAFMPFIVAGHLAMVLASSALLLRRSSRPLPALLLGSAVALSALTSLGVLYQLLAQVFGVTMLVALVAVFVRVGDISSFRPRNLGPTLLCGLLATGLTAVYPEVLPFALIPMGGYAAVRVIQRKISVWSFLTYNVVMLGFPLVALQGYAIDMYSLIVNRLLGAEAADVHRAFLFPYYLLPTGFSNFWNLVPVAQLPHEPWLSLSIGLGMLLSAALLACVIRQIIAGEGVPWVTLVMFVLTVSFFMKRLDFPLYKMAMYAQPFAYAALIAAAYRFRLRTIGLAMLSVVLAVSASVQLFYVNVSRDVPGSPGFGFVEAPHASSNHLLEQLQKIESTNVKVFESDAVSRTLAEYEVAYVGRRLIFFDETEFRISLGLTRGWFYLLGPLPRTLEQRTKLLKHYIALSNMVMRSHMFDYRPKIALFATASIPDGLGDNASLIASTARQTILNRSHDLSTTSDVETELERRARNHVSFVATTLGTAAGEGTNLSIYSLFQLEPDYYVHGGSMSALGRYLFLRVRHPSERVRLILNVTSTLNADFQNIVPPARVIGKDSVRFNNVGRGSARMVSKPIVPQYIAGNPYFSLDMGRVGRRFPTRRSGLMLIFGKDVDLDPRLVVCFGRDISLISDDEYQAWRRPSSVSKFPDDLTNPKLEYSGLYEDGWIAENGYLVLNALPGRTQRLKIAGVVPLIHAKNFELQLTVSIDRRKVGQIRLPLGTFQFERKLAVAPGRHTLQLAFSRTQVIPIPDGRKVSARLYFAGFERP